MILKQLISLDPKSCWLFFTTADEKSSRWVKGQFRRDHSADGSGRPPPRLHLREAVRGWLSSRGWSNMERQATHPELWATTVAKTCKATCKTQLHTSLTYSGHAEDQPLQLEWRQSRPLILLSGTPCSSIYLYIYIYIYIYRETPFLDISEKIPYKHVQTNKQLRQ